LVGVAARDDTGFSVAFDKEKSAGGLAGNLRFAPSSSGAPAALSGDIKLQSLKLASLANSLTGQAWRGSQNNAQSWSQGRFELAFPEAVTGAVGFELEQLELSAGNAMFKLTGQLGFEPSSLRLNLQSAELFKGNLTGSGQLMRQSEGLSLSGQGQLSGADISQFVWQNEGRALGSGSASVGLRFEGFGQSPAAVVSGLSGQGTLSLKDLQVRKLNTGAFAAITRASQAGIELSDERVRDVFASYLATGSFDAEAIDMAVALSSGQLRIDNARLERGDERFRLAANLNLNPLTLDADLTIRSEGDLVVGGTAPEATLVFSGEVHAPERRLDVSALTGYLTVLALEREVERIETLQADILEREKFNRILRAQAAARLKQKLAEEAAEAARRKALEEERKAKQAEEAAQAAKALQKEINIGFPPGFKPDEAIAPPIDLGAPSLSPPPSLPQVGPQVPN
jgi:hypothetical protein